MNFHLYLKDNGRVETDKEYLGVTLFFTTRPGIKKHGSDEVYRLNAVTPKLTANKFLERLKEYHEK